jgi:transketolase
MYSTETQERKQHTAFKETQQHIQEQKQRITPRVEADTQERQKAWKRTLKSGRKHGTGHSRAAESMKADTQERQITLEFTEQVSKCSKQVSVAFKSDKFEVPILFYNSALNNLKPLIFVISNDYLTSNCYECVTIFTGPEFG